MVFLENNQFCPCYPRCNNEIFSNFATTQDTSLCSYCDEGYTQICDILPESVTILDGDSTCFKTDNLNVLTSFIDSSLANFPDSLDISMLSDSTASIEDLKKLELGEQLWSSSKLIYFDVRDRGLSGGIPENIGDLDSLYSINLSNNNLRGELPNSIYTLLNLYIINISGNQLHGGINPIFCTIIDNWEINGLNPNRSYLDNNSFCPPYQECLLPYMGEQDTSECITGE